MSLALISESDATASFDARTGRSKPQGSPPPGTRFNEDGSGPPNKDRSLHDHYKWHLSDAADKSDLRRYLHVLGLAEYEARRARYRAPTKRWVGRREHIAEVRERVLTAYLGWDLRDVAHVEGVSTDFVRKAWKKAGVNREMVGV